MQQHLKWFYLVLLSLIWGSSFILIKKGLIGLSPLQLGALRISFAAIFLLAIGFKNLFSITWVQWKWMIVSGFLGTFFPAFCFAFAETEIDSSIVSILNSTTPIMALILGVAVFRVPFNRFQVIGVVVGILGSLGLIMSGASIKPEQNYIYTLLVIGASAFYALNINIIKRYLQEVSPIKIAVGNFASIAIPAMFILVFTDFFEIENLNKAEVQSSLVYLFILGVVGTAIALIIFNKLIQISDPVFASSVTYLIPVVAFMWGFWDGERFSLLQVISAGVILFGVLIVNKKRRIRA